MGSRKRNGPWRRCEVAAPPAGSRGPTPTHQRSASVEKSARRASGDRTWTEIRSMNVAGDALQAAPCP